jgi:SAM-dependent methyltransferase
MAQRLREVRLRHLYIRRVLRRAITGAVRRWARGVLVDVGCGTKRYADVVGEVAERHIGLDHPASYHRNDSVDVFGLADALPFAAGSVDTVFCAEVLEHLEEPALAVVESFQCLRPGGTAIFTCPFIWHIHEAPRDFFRYSPYGLRHLFTSAGFEIVELTPLNRFWTTFGQLLVYKISSYNRGVVRFIPVIPLVVLLMQGVLVVADLIPGSDEWPSHHLVVARKPERPEAAASRDGATTAREAASAAAEATFGGGPEQGRGA